MNTKQDRKTKYFKECIVINNEELRINANENKGVYTEIIKSIVKQLDIALSIHNRLLVNRIDLHVNYYSYNNKIISRYINRIKQWIRRNYNIEKIGYIWVREQERSKKQHYHLALFLDGDKIRHPSKLNTKLKEMWSSHGYMPVIKHPFYFIDKNNHTKEREEAIYRMSYLAKTRGKRYRDEQVKDYQASRLKPL